MLELIKTTHTHRAAALKIVNDELSRLRRKKSKAPTNTEESLIEKLNLNNEILELSTNEKICLLSLVRSEYVRMGNPETRRSSDLVSTELLLEELDSILCSHIIRVNGDATNPYKVSKHQIIAHVCNDLRRWGAGFSGQLSTKYPASERAYRSGHWQLGSIQIVEISETLSICNMIAQHGIRKNKYDPPAIDLTALTTCLQLLEPIADSENSSIHMPKIGAGLGGGKWENIEPIIEENLQSFTYIYTLN